MMQIMPKRILKDFDRLSLYLVCEFEASTSAWLRAPVSLFNTSFFYSEAKFMPAELNQANQYIGDNMDAYLKRFHEKALIAVIQLLNMC